MNFQRFGKRVCVFLYGLDLSEFVSDHNLIFVGNDGQKAFFSVLSKKVAERCHGLISKGASGFLSLRYFFHKRYN